MDEPVTAPGENLITLLSRAKETVLIVAPFIRSEALVRLLDSIPHEVDTSVVTRWLPGDLLSGASDLGVFDLTQERCIPLLLRNDLHAKFFAADEECLIGSANVTLTALGWRFPANLELLSPVSRTAPSIAAFEKQLFAAAIPATQAQRDRLQDLLKRLEKQPGILVSKSSSEGNAPGQVPSSWIPHTMNPEELYFVYKGDIEKVSRTALPQMQKEIAQLAIPPHMPQDNFSAWIGATISQTPLVSRVTEHIEKIGSIDEPRFARLLQEIGINTTNYPAHEGLQVLQRWLTYFFGEYKTTRDTIKLTKTQAVL